jgi:hypothetical protein
LLSLIEPEGGKQSALSVPRPHFPPVHLSGAALLLSAARPGILRAMQTATCIIGSIICC